MEVLYINQPLYKALEHTLTTEDKENIGYISIYSPIFLSSALNETRYCENTVSNHVIKDCIMTHTQRQLNKGAEDNLNSTIS